MTMEDMHASWVLVTDTGLTVRTSLCVQRMRKDNRDLRYHLCGSCNRRQGRAPQLELESTAVVWVVKSYCMNSYYGLSEQLKLSSPCCADEC